MPSWIQSTPAQLGFIVEGRWLEQFPSRFSCFFFIPPIKTTKNCFQQKPFSESSITGERCEGSSEILSMKTSNRKGPPAWKYIISNYITTPSCRISPPISPAKQHNANVSRPERNPFVGEIFMGENSIKLLDENCLNKFSRTTNWRESNCPAGFHCCADNKLWNWIMFSKWSQRHDTQ